MFNSIVEAVFAYAASQPQKLCLADDTGSVTYREFAERVARYARCFADAGIAPGDRVVVEACQTVDYLAIQQGLQLVGGVFVPVEHNSTPMRLADFAALSGAVGMITCEEQDAPVRLKATFDGMLGLRDTAEPLHPASFPARDAVCEILFSTGTTGKEKGIVLTNGNNIALAENVIYGVEMLPDNVELIPSPLNHSHGLRRCYANLVNGSSVVLLGSAMNLRQLFYDLDAYGVNAIDLVPSALSVALKLSKNRLADYRDRLRYIQFGAAPMPEGDRNRIRELLPNTRLYNFYGSTESGCTALYNFNRPDPKQNCIGKPTRNADIFIVDDDRRPIAATVENPGLLASAGPMNTPGYWENPEETAKVLLDGAVYSNDIAYFDGDGDIILMGRRGDVINVGGSKVSPEEIEDAARQLPGIADCGVVPVDDAAKGSVPKLFVQMAPGCAFDARAIHDGLTQRLEPVKRPAYFVQIARIPRSFNGKLLRRELKEL